MAFSPLLRMSLNRKRGLVPPFTLENPHMPSPRTLWAATSILLVLAVGAGRAHAEEQPFAQMYTPYLDARGESELELSSQASHGQAGSAGPRWYNRLEFEH